MVRRLLIAAAALAACSTNALAGDAAGEWARTDGKAHVRFAPCGGALCGTITWLQDPKSGKGKVGEQVFFDMKPNGENAWYGSAYNPEDGKNYTGKMSLSGATLTTSGCVLGGLFCKSFTWTRL